MKICSKCKQERDDSEFYKQSSRKDGLYSSCKKCFKDFVKNSVNRKTREKEFRESKEGKAYIAKYAKEHREKLNNYKKEYVKRRVDVDIQFRIASSLRARMRRAVKRGYKSGSSVNDLGCTISEFKSYIEKQFLPGMTWENWGMHMWHIDHIKPLSSFDLTKREQFLEACHYTNLRPLWAKDNLSKGSKIEL